MQCTRGAAHAVPECSVPPEFARALKGKGMAYGMGLKPFQHLNLTVFMVAGMKPAPHSGWPRLGMLPAHSRSLIDV